MVLASLVTGKYLFSAEYGLQVRQDPMSYILSSWAAQGTLYKLLWASAFSSVFICSLGASSGVHTRLRLEDGQGN